MLKLTISEYQKTFRTPPKRQTIVRWCEIQELPSRKIGGRWYIFGDEQIVAEKTDPILNRILG